MTTTTTIDCTFTIQVPLAAKSAYSGSSKSPYVFNSGTLLLLFNPIVQSWFQQQSALSLASQQTYQAGQSYSTIALQVSTRFASALGSPIPVTQFTNAISSQTGLPAANVFDISVW